MKRKALPILAVIVLLTMVGCATTSFDKQAYTTVASAKTVYDTTMSALGNLQAQGKLSDADIQKILPIARIYYQAYLVAEAAYEVYHKSLSSTDQDKLITTLTDAAAKLSSLSAILVPYNITVQQLSIPTK